MKHKSERILSLLLGGIIMTASFVTAGCGTTPTPEPPPQGETPVEPDNPSQGETPSNPDNPNTPPEGETPVEPPAPPPDPPKLLSLTLDDGTDLDFDSSITSYSVRIPAGRPRIPRVSAAAEDADAEVSVYQAMFGENVTETYARVEVSLNGVKQDYKINFVKDEALGFALQYDDRYQFVPDTQTEGANIVYYTSDNTVATVDTNGVITAKACSQTPVTITAYENGVAIDALTVDRIDKAQLNIFMITGQSNAAGTYDDDYNTERPKCTLPPEGVARCLDVDSNGNFYPIYDMHKGREGFAPALVNKWYELSGEKVFVIHSAVGGAPIETWQKDGDKYLGGNLYNNTLKAYNKYRPQFDAEDSSYEVVRVGYFWCQGETAQWAEWKGSYWENLDHPSNYIMPAEDYYDIFMQNHANFVADMDADFASIALVRCLASRASVQNSLYQYCSDLVPVRAGQYTLHNLGEGEVFIASRVGDIARPLSSPDKTSPGYGYMGSGNLHYSQMGYNVQGEELAINTFSHFSATVDRTPVDLEVIASNGRTRLSDGDTVTVDREDGYRLAAAVLPIYTDAPKVSYRIVSGSAKCTVNEYGFISFDSSATDGESATLVIESESGLKKQFTVVLGQVDRDAVSGTPVSYTWNFDNFKEANNKNKLSLSENSPKGQYFFNGGVLVKNDQDTDFAMEKPFLLANSFDWSIEWRGLASAASILFGGNVSNINFIYLAYNVPEFNHSLRFVTSDNVSVYLPYGRYAEYNYSMNTWLLDYKQATQTMTLYFRNAQGTWETVSSYTWTGKGYLMYLTNVFGRFGDPNVHVCYKGQIDYITVNAMTLD